MNIISANTNSTPKVSVIIPIYNTEAYLTDSLDSICKQSLQDIEIILINDGSTDNSRNIIEEYAKNDRRIKHFTQTNQGQGVARNHGLQFATGKYIYFMDSDDMLEIEALEHCYETCELNKLDFVFFDAETIVEYDTLNTYNYDRKKYFNENKLWNGLDLLKCELGNDIFSVSPCLFFSNFSFLKKVFSGFPSGIIHEDQAFAMQIKLNAKRVCYIACPYFKRRIRAFSTTTSPFSMRNIEGYTTVFNLIYNWGQQREEWQSIINLYLVKTINSVVWLSHRMTFLEKMETYCRLRRLKLSKYVTLRNWIVFWFKPFTRPRS